MDTKKVIFIVLLFVTSGSLFAQMKSSYRAETFGSLATGENTPFWMTNQNWGVVSLDANNYYVRGGVFHEQKINTDWSWEAGFDMLGASKAHYGNFWVQQLYGRVNWKIWRLDIGSREDYVSFLNPYLSSGDFTHSNNSRPIPEIKVSIPQFLLVPYTKGNMYIKGDFSLGHYLDGQWQEDTAKPNNQNYVKNLYSHNKSIYFRFGNIETKNKMQFTVGLAHSAQWGGDLHKYSYIDDEWKYTVLNQPRGLSDLLRVAIAKEGSSSSSNADNAYVAGSQWGAYLLKYDYKLKNEDLLSFYVNHFFDDGSGMAFENYRDNLLGFEYKSKNKSILSGAVFEYNYTKQQTGPIHHNMKMDEDHKHLMSKGNGNDNYYNNTDYVQGPSHFGKTLGSPFLLSPEYNRDGALNFKSSRIIAFHLGLEGYLLSSLQYRLLLSNGQTWGRYYVPFTKIKKGFASGMELIYKYPSIEDLSIKLSMGYDNGEFFGENSFGGGITISKTGIICAK